MQHYYNTGYELEFQNRTLPYIVEARASELGDKTFFMYQDQEVSYRELDENVNRVANTLLEMGVKKGDKICFMMKNSIEFIYSWFALGKIGALMVPMNPALKGKLLEYIINNSEATIAFVDNDLLERFRFVEDGIKRVGRIVSVKENADYNEKVMFKNAQLVQFEELMLGSTASPRLKVDPQNPMSILYTSGTTGPSKGAVLSHHYYYYNAISAIHWMRHCSDDILYSCLPFFHANASITSIYTALMAGATFSMGKRFSLTTFMDEIARYKATHTNVMGSILVLLMKQKPKPDDANNTLKVVNSVPLIPESLEFEKRFGVKLIGMYGATETCICIVSPFDEETRPESCGKALPQYDCRIFDDNDMECPAGEKGEIVVRGRLPFIQMEGYYNMPEETLASFRNLWYHTGDYGIKDKEGYFYFVDRKKDAIRRRGENISSYEVEDVVNSHPAVLESAAVAIKDKEMTEDEVKICVILKKGWKLSHEGLISYCKDRMAYYMVPRYVEFMDDFPKTPNQKIEKYKLRDRGLTKDTWDREKAGVRVDR
ncbi:MAG: ATP-dependent acyl-CoA ligase [Deltaproteobacteria bacterium]|nr:ATP-dependent acyl-CoA ligase [Deltaproteobacteria bacterium]MBW2046569.1 ATP-dependent acyl-CoA ligase [Deltaproteobacteria bacterium]MBW2302046.1 ATP-dependent acyl-CoA ligase [Deltaproteobacteria bacterium]